MKRLKHYIEESLLDNEDELASSPDEVLIKDYINKNYKVYGAINIRKDGDQAIVDINGNVYLRKAATRTMTALTNGFTFGIVKNFDCHDCINLESLEGAPQECKEFVCGQCPKLKTLEGAPQKCNQFYCSGCESLETLEGAPQKCWIFYCDNCPKLETLEGAPQKCYERFYCTYCSNLKTLKGAPQKCGSFTCDNCPKLETLEGAPRDCVSISCEWCKNLRSLKGYSKVSTIIVGTNPKLTDYAGAENIMHSMTRTPQDSISVTSGVDLSRWLND